MEDQDGEEYEGDEEGLKINSGNIPDDNIPGAEKIY